MNYLSEALRGKIEDKIRELSGIANEIPGVIIVHRLPEFSVEYMSERGLNYFGVSLDEIKAMGTNYHPNYFNEDDASDYFPKVIEMIEKNDVQEMASYFQQVRDKPDVPWTWYFSTTKIFMQDDNGIALLAITIAIPVDQKQHVSSKLERLLEEHIFLRENKELFLSLTNREREILKLLAMSFTVETHRKNLRKKLGITKPYELNKFASAFDLI